MLTLEALGVTLGANGLHFGIPWGNILVILGCLGSILAPCGWQNPTKDIQSAYFTDLADTLENQHLMFWEGFEGWRRPSWLQNELLETLEADFGADEITLETLRGSWML